MADKKLVITHLQIIHTWSEFARERDLQFFTAKHLEDIAQWSADAIAMLKEQEAKPIAYTDNPYTKLPVAHCPKCGKFARQFHTEHPGEETKYCPWCGQLLKWEEDDA